jgi:hypothetical protein
VDYLAGDGPIKAAGDLDSPVTVWLVRQRSGNKIIGAVRRGSGNDRPPDSNLQLLGEAKIASSGGNVKPTA